MKTANDSAALNYTLRLTGQPPCPIPSIEVPADDQLFFNQYGWPSFTIETGSGPINCSPWCSNFSCSGSAEALAAYGLLRQEWMPGIPGNNKTRQTVVFTESGPALAIGRFSRNKYSASPPYLVVVRQGNKVSVEIPMTSDQKEWLTATHDKRRNQPPPLPASQPAQVIQITSRPRLQPGDYAYIHYPGNKNDGLVVMIERESYIEKGKYSVTSLGMPFTSDDGKIGFEANVLFGALRRISRSYFESRPIFKVG